MSKSTVDDSLLKQLFDDMALQDVKMTNGMFEVNGQPGESEDVMIQGFNSHLACIPSDFDGLVLYTFRYGCGVRLVRSDEVGDEEASPFFEVMGEFEASYLAQHEYEQPILDAFGRAEVGMQVWPYWREFVQSSSNRMGIHELRIGSFPRPEAQV